MGLYMYVFESGYELEASDLKLPNSARRLDVDRAVYLIDCIPMRAIAIAVAGRAARLVPKSAGL